MWGMTIITQSLPLGTHFLQPGSTSQSPRSSPNSITNSGLSVQISESIGDISHSTTTLHFLLYSSVLQSLHRNQKAFSKISFNHVSPLPQWPLIILRIKSKLLLVLHEVKNLWPLPVSPALFLALCLTPFSLLAQTCLVFLEQTKLTCERDCRSLWNFPLPRCPHIPHSCVLLRCAQLLLPREITPEFLSHYHPLLFIL